MPLTLGVPVPPVWDYNLNQQKNCRSLFIETQTAGLPFHGRSFAGIPGKEWIAQWENAIARFALLQATLKDMQVKYEELGWEHNRF